MNSARLPSGVTDLWGTKLNVSKTKTMIVQILCAIHPQPFTITIKRRNSKKGHTTPYEIFGIQEVIKTLSDSGHWKKKGWITINKKSLLSTNYDTSDESTLKMGVRQPSSMQPTLRIKMSKRISSFNCNGLRTSNECVAESVKYDLVTLQETRLFNWNLAIPSTLAVDVTENQNVQENIII